MYFFFFFQAEDGIRDLTVTGVQTCALPICSDSESVHGDLRRARRQAEFLRGAPDPLPGNRRCGRATDTVPAFPVCMADVPFAPPSRRRVRRVCLARV